MFDFETSSGFGSGMNPLMTVLIVVFAYLLHV